MKVYIAGPMTGHPEHNYPAFHTAAAAWREAGWEVANPAEHFGGDQTRSYEEYVAADVAVLKTCDAIAMLPQWDAGHSGAIWEHAIASQLLGLIVYDAADVREPPYLHVAARGVAEFVDAVLGRDTLAALPTPQPLHFEWPPYEPHAVVPLSCGGSHNALARRAPDRHCPVCARVYQFSTWDGECSACEPEAH